MKLDQLPMGARFEYEGECYIKTGPLTGKAERGGNRMIPRSAVLKPLDYMPAPAQEPQGMVARKAVLAAFEDFYRQCAHLVDESGRLSLNAAKQQFLKRLG